MSGILADTKRLLNIEDETQDELLAYIIEDTVNMIMAHCHLKMLPYQLYGLVPQIAVSVYRSSQKGNVSAIWEGDRKIEYRMEDVLADYSARLSPFINRKGTLPSEVSLSE